MFYHAFFVILISSLTNATITVGQKISFKDNSAERLPQRDLRTNSMDVVSGDINGDGHEDLIIASEFRQNLILINDGSGRFINETNKYFPAKNHDSEDIALADFDGDGHLDIIFVSEDDQKNEYYRNDGNGSFEDKSDDFPVTGISNGIAYADLDGDGDLDIIIGNEGQDHLLLNDGKGNFTNETSGRMPLDLSITQDVQAADLNGDGALDLVFGNEDGNRIYINDGRGSFKNETTTRMPSAPGGEETRKVAIADIDRDGDPDIIFANVNFRGTNAIANRILINDGKGFFTDETAERYKGINTFHSADVVFSDLDGDGDPDLIVANVFGRQPQTFINDGRGYFTERSGILPAHVSTESIAILARDLDGDNVTDLYFGIFRGADIFLKGTIK